MRTKTPIEQAIEALESISTIDEDPRYGHTSDTVLLLQCQSRATAAISALRQPSPSVDMEQKREPMSDHELIQAAKSECPRYKTPDGGPVMFDMTMREMEAWMDGFVAGGKYHRSKNKVLEARPSAGEEGEQWCSVDELKDRMNHHRALSLPEGTVLVWRRRSKPNHNWERGIYVENDDRARDQFNIRSAEVMLIEWPKK